jgi:nitrite reductase/ring-hydroxylating ferredoxin subunit
MRRSKVHFFTVFILVPIIFSSSCKREEQHPVPDVYVNFTIHLLTDPEFFRLRTQGNSVIIHSYDIAKLSLGYNNNGVIIYNNGDGEFYAFDCTCPYDLPVNAAVEISEISGIAVCPVCGSEYVLTSMGAPTLDSPAHWSLKEYHASYYPSTGDLYVSH